MGLLDEYQMFECLEVCGRFMQQHLTVEDICWAYNWAIYYNIDGLKRFCEQKISLCSEAVFKTTGFLTCDYNIFERIVKLDTLACFEISVLDACLHWARTACARDGVDATQTENIRKYLKDTIYSIRFSSIGGKELIKVINMYPKLFSDPEDYEEIFRLTCGEKDLKTDRFRISPRSVNLFLWDPTQMLGCNLGTDLLQQNAQSPLLLSQSTIFTSNEPLLLGGIKIRCIKNLALPLPNMQQMLRLPSMLHRNTVEFAITITEEFKNSKRIVFSRSYNEELVNFIPLQLSPIFINPSYVYTIDVTHTNRNYQPIQLKPEIKLSEKTTIKVIAAHLSVIEQLQFNEL